MKPFKQGCNMHDFDVDEWLNEWLDKLMNELWSNWFIKHQQLMCYDLNHHAQKWGKILTCAVFIYVIMITDAPLI